MNLGNSASDSLTKKDSIMFDTLKNISACAAQVAGKVAVIAAGVTIGTLAAAKIAEALKSES